MKAADRLPAEPGALVGGGGAARFRAPPILDNRSRPGVQSTHGIEEIPALLLALAQDMMEQLLTGCVRLV